MSSPRANGTSSSLTTPPSYPMNDLIPLHTPLSSELSFMIKKQPSLSKIYPRLESPLIKVDLKDGLTALVSVFFWSISQVVQTLNSVRDNHDTPPDVREALDKAVVS